MIELAPGWSVEVEDSTQNHWVGSCGDLVMTFAYEGSYNDPQHVYAMTRCIKRVTKNNQRRVRMLFVVPPLHAKPPDEQVRRVLVQEMRRTAAQVALAAVVVAGTGFGAAIHRGVVTGVLAVVRPEFRFLVAGSVHAGLGFLFDKESAVFQPLLRYCEDRTKGPGAK